MRFLTGLALVLGAVVSTMAIKEPPTTLQIGVKKRIPAEECTIKSNNGDELSMHYTGTLFDSGDKFDSSLDRNQPFVFKLGQGQVIQGWDQGLVGMCIGEKRKLVIPPHMGYGDRGAGGGLIPGGATLVFEVELLDIKKGDRSSFKPTDNATEDHLTFTSPTFIISTAVMLGLFFIVFKIAKKQDTAEANKKATEELKEKK